MEYRVTCECGHSFIAGASEAGTCKRCHCGVNVAVPSLSALKSSIIASPEADHASAPVSASNRSISFVIGIAIAMIILGLFAPPILGLAGMMTVIYARFWFAAQILREMKLSNALLVFFVPFMPTLFLIKRFEIAWKPFALGLVGCFAYITYIAWEMN